MIDVLVNSFELRFVVSPRFFPKYDAGNYKV